MEPGFGALPSVGAGPLGLEPPTNPEEAICKTCRQFLDFCPGHRPEEPSK